ncbi:hypothetical protein [Soonwooa sp.]|uniref:hypothetical protein n=1 Tax=Soonwooa sp. TaxID=1938592 RepID=UPI0035AF682B
MLDNIKIKIYDQDIISRLITHQGFIQGKPLNNNYHTLVHKEIGAKLSLNLRKAFENKILIGYRHVELIISPHYHYNNYTHNANDFNPKNCINTIIEILNYLGIENNQYTEFKVVNLEFGLNIIPSTDIENLINGILQYKTKDFLVDNFPFNKKTDATTFKQIKAYAKGLQFIDNPEYSINPNTFRFEIKTKQSKYLKTLCIKSISDLLNIDTYKRLCQALLDDWEHIFLLNLKPNYKHLNSNEAQFVKQCNKPQYWQQYQNEMHRNSVRKNKDKYCHLLKGKNNLHLQIKSLIIDKLLSFSECANSTQKTPLNKGNNNITKTSKNKINLEFAHRHYINPQNNYSY